MTVIASAELFVLRRSRSPSPSIRLGLCFLLAVAVLHQPACGFVCLIGEAFAVRGEARAGAHRDRVNLDIPDPISRLPVDLMKSDFFAIGSRGK